MVGYSSTETAMPPTDESDAVRTVIHASHSHSIMSVADVNPFESACNDDSVDTGIASASCSKVASIYAESADMDDEDDDSYDPLHPSIRTFPPKGANGLTHFNNDNGFRCDKPPPPINGMDMASTLASGSNAIHG